MNDRVAVARRVLRPEQSSPDCPDEDHLTPVSRCSEPWSPVPPPQLAMIPCSVQLVSKTVRLTVSPGLVGVAV